MADMVGYSRLMGADEPGTLAQFKKQLREFIEPTIQECSGRLVKTLGDGLLVEFDSPVNAVNCAISIQANAAKNAASMPGGPPLRYRIGVNFGDIIADGDDIVGDVVNIAARIQALAEPGETHISHAVFEHVKGKVTADFDELGERALKNIAQPILVYRVRSRSGHAHPSAELPLSVNPVVAVLPFTAMSGDPEQQYFSDGMAEDIITELSRFRTVSVIARNSSFVYRDRATDVQQIGRDLGAQFVVEGSVRKFADSARITVQLVNSEWRHHIWAERYDTALADIFKVQDDVTRRVVASIVPRIESEELEVARRRPTSHMRAYDCYLRGKAEYYAARDGAGIEKSRHYFNEAVRLDPVFASAYCYLAKIENTMSMFVAAGTPLGPFRERAWHLTNKAASLDSNDAVTQLSLAWGHLYRREFDAARRHFDISSKLNPNDAELAVDRGTTLMCLGEADAAIGLILTGLRLNPLHQESCLADLAEAYFVAHRYEDMIQAAEQIGDPTPRFSAWRAAGYAMAGRGAEAKHHAEVFLKQLNAIWEGAPGAGPGEYVDWLLSWSPFRRLEDRDHLLEGLRCAGLRFE